MRVPPEALRPKLELGRLLIAPALVGVVLAAGLASGADVGLLQSARLQSQFCLVAKDDLLPGDILNSRMLEVTQYKLSRNFTQRPCLPAAAVLNRRLREPLPKGFPPTSAMLINSREWE